MKISNEGLSLIKSFEGLRLTSYYCSSGILTVGYGHTGPDVYEGMTITDVEANDLLRRDVSRFEKCVSDLISVTLDQRQFDALVSFAFNCGEGALSTSTLRKRLNLGQPICIVMEEELPKWVNGSHGPLEGLVRRRNAEINHACSRQQPTEPIVDDFILNAVKYYKGLPHQNAAWVGLWDHLTPELQEWFQKAYRNNPQAFEPHEDQDEDKNSEGYLDVPYFYQYDSATSHGGRMCFTSSMAMALDYINPDVIDGDDDWYLEIVLYYGDTVSSEAQIQAARSLGFKAEFRMDGTEKLLCDLLDKSIPVPIGILHNGGLDRPTGGGHWICLIGHTDTHFIVNDPAGELDLLNGGYLNGSGEHQYYSKKNLMKRWNIANDHDGWLVDLQGN